MYQTTDKQFSAYLGASQLSACVDIGRVTLRLAKEGTPNSRLGHLHRQMLFSMATDFCVAVELSTHITIIDTLQQVDVLRL